MAEGRLTSVRAGDEAGARELIEGGFSLWLTAMSPEDLSGEGWQHMNDAMLAGDEVCGFEALASAKAAWKKVGRLDLIRDWIEVEGIRAVTMH